MLKLIIESKKLEAWLVDTDTCERVQIAGPGHPGSYGDVQTSFSRAYGIRSKLTLEVFAVEIKP